MCFNVKDDDEGKRKNDDNEDVWEIVILQKEDMTGT
jgi:hypothetical protein